MIETTEVNVQSTRVLIIDDNPHFRRLLQSVLNTLGFKQIEEAVDGSTALKELAHFQADLALVDWRMAPMDGLDFTRFIRSSADSPNRYLPIIMLSGYTEMSLVLEARDAGVNEFVAKPISAKTLQTRILSVLTAPRPFVKSKDYFGPDRRRRQHPLKGQDRRKS